MIHPSEAMGLTPPAESAQHFPRYRARGRGRRPGLSLVRFRAQAMQQAVPVGTGAMAAILGLDAAAVGAGCAAAREATEKARIAQTLIVPQHIWSKVKDPATFKNPKPVGSGPFLNITRLTTQDIQPCLPDDIDHAIDAFGRRCFFGHGSSPRSG